MLKIYVDRLRNKEKEILQEKISPTFLDINEKEIEFKNAITIKGKTSICEKNLLLEIDVTTTVHLPCIVCNKQVEIPVLCHICNLLPLDEIDVIYDYSDLLRLEILLQIPSFVECNDGNCSERKQLEKYLTKNKKDMKEKIDNNYPFKKLEK